LDALISWIVATMKISPLLALIPCVCTALATQASCLPSIAAKERLAPVSSSRAKNPLVAAFVEALNKGDEVSLRAFVDRWCTSQVAAADRVSRFKNLAQQGAPFTLSSVDERPSQLMVVLEDRNHEKLGFKIELSADGKYDRAMAGPPEALNAPPPKDYSGWKDLGSLAEQIRKNTDNPAIGIAILKQGKLEQAVRGTRTLGGNEAVGVDEPWSIGSIGKPICSSIIGKLIETGKLRWDTTLGEALGYLPMKPDYKPVTIEQIMHHRGGIPAYLGLRRPEVERIVNGATDPVKIRENFARDILSKDPIGKPDERFVYSNAGYALLGVIAEHVTGERYEQLVHEFVFEPLHLKNSFTAMDPLPKARPRGHVRGPNGLEVMDSAGPLETLFAPAGGGIFMSLSDMAHFGNAHLDGLKGRDGFLRSATIQRLHRGEPEEQPGGRLYACGWGIEQVAGGLTMHMHNGSNGTMRAQLSIFPELDLVVASFVNAGGEMEPSPPLQAVLAVAKKYRG
jgi:CubicO group peptidase (beta-lactamase class C family)